MEIRARYVLIGLFTLAVIAGGFGFVYWLNRTGGLGERALYEVRFETSVWGLLLGSEVTFNGLRVGEVTNLTIDPDDPRAVIASIAVAAETPIRADTRAGLDFSGLTGTAAVALTGGAGASPALEGADGKPPLLNADPAAAQDWTRAAREALGRVNGVLAENSDNLQAAIENIRSFAEALGRNSDRVDKIAAGLERLTGSSGPGAAATIYDLKAPTRFDPGLRAPETTLVLPTPTSAVTVDTPRFLVGTEGAEKLTFDDAKLSDNIPALVRARVIQAFENAGYMKTGTDTQGLFADRQLLLDIRAFRIDTSEAKPAARVEFTAKILGSDGQLIAARMFEGSAPADAVEPAPAAAALSQAFGQAATELVTWAMQTPGAPQ